jgi:hypothetical protein
VRHQHQVAGRPVQRRDQHRRPAQRSHGPQARSERLQQACLAPSTGAGARRHALDANAAPLRGPPRRRRL